jgi:hypothetical protein
VTSPGIGNYLEAGFIETLTKTRSIVMALKSCRDRGVADSALVYDAHPGLGISQGENWHEGQNVFRLFPDGTVKNGSDNPGTTELDIQDNRHVTTRSGKLEANFVFVGDARKFIRHIVLMGRYLDDYGKSYEFKDDGSGSFAGEPVSYGLDLDDFSSDSFSTRTRTIAFQWHANVLTLYPTFPVPDGAEGYGAPDLEHPIAHLHPVE